MSVGEPNPLAFQMLTKDSILFCQVGHDVLLLAIEPPSQRNDDELPRVKDHRRYFTVSPALQAGQSGSFEAPPN